VAKENINESILKPSQAVIGFLFSALVIIYVLWSLNWSLVKETLSIIDWTWISLALLIYLFNYVLRTIRFRILFNQFDAPFHHLLGLTNLYGMYLYLLPAKTGELTFPLLLKRRLNIKVSTSAGTLIIARVFDFFTIALILPIVLFIYWNTVPYTFKIASLVFCLVVLFSLSLFIWTLRNNHRVIGSLEKRTNNWPVIQRIKTFLTDVYLGMVDIKLQDKYIIVFLLTLGIWLCINAIFFLITKSLGFNINFFQIVVVSIIMIPVTLFPIQGFANLGAHEIGWVTAFSMFNYQYSDALNIAVSTHILYIGFVLILGFIGFLLIPRSTDMLERLSNAD
jgi:uncharacterized protein (TIRG00374 family)